MGYSSYEDKKAEANRIIWEKRSRVTVQKSSDKFIKRTYTSKIVRVSGLDDLRRDGNNENYGNHYQKTNTKPSSIEKTHNAKKSYDRKVISHKSCDREERNNSYSSEAYNQCKRKLRHATRRLSKLEHAVDNEIKILKHKKLSIIEMIAKSEITENDQKPSTYVKSRTKDQETRKDITVEQYSKKHKKRHAGNGSLSLKPKARTVASQINTMTDENRPYYEAFGDHTSNLKNKAYFKAVGGDESPTVAKEFITSPLVNGGYEQTVNICYGCYKPYQQCISSGACRSFVCNPQKCSRGYASLPCPEYCPQEYYCLNPQAPRSHTQKCMCNQRHNNNCCQCMEKELQISKSYKRRITDLKTQDFYYRKSESRTSSKSPSPDKSKSVKHRTNSKLVQNKRNNSKTKEPYEEQGVNGKKETDVEVTKDEEHLKQKKVNKNENKRGLFKKTEKSTSELSEQFDNILIKTFGEEGLKKLMQISDYVSEEIDKPLNTQKNAAEKEHMTPVSEVETFKVSNKERDYKNYLSKPKPTTNSSTSPRYYSQDTSFGHSYETQEAQYPSETLRMLRNMKFREHKATTPTANRKVDHETNRPRKEIEENNIIHNDKYNRYNEYMKKYKTHESHMCAYDDYTVQAEHESHKISAKHVNDIFEEQWNADGSASSGMDYYKEQDNVYKYKEHPESKYDFKDGVEKIKHTKDPKHHSGTPRRIQESVGNKDTTSTSVSTEQVYKENISNIEHKHLIYKNGTQNYSTRSKKGYVDESVKYEIEKQQNVQGGVHNADNKVNIVEKRRVNSTSVMEQLYRSEKPLHDLSLSKIAEDVYEMPRTSQDKKNPENRNTSKFLTDNIQHMNDDSYYKNGTPSEYISQGYIRSNGRNENQVSSNSQIEISQYSNSNKNSVNSRIRDVTEGTKCGRSYVISPRARDAKNEYKEIKNELERNLTDGTDPKGLYELQNKSTHVFTPTPCEKTFTGNKEVTMPKPQSSFEEFDILEKSTIPNKKISEIKVSTDKRISNTKLKVYGENTKLDNDESLSTSHSIHMEEATEAMNHHFGLDNKECARCCENHSPNKITKDNDFIECTDGKSENKYQQGRIHNSSLDTLRYLRDVLNLYKKGTLEDESLKALAEELLANLSSNCSYSRVNYRGPEDMSTLTRQEKRTIEVQCSDQELFEGFNSGGNNITITELSKTTESSVMEVPSNENVVNGLQEHADTTVNLESGSSHQDTTTIKKCWSNDIKLKTIQDLHTKIEGSNGSLKTIATTDKYEEQEPRYLETPYKTIQSKASHQEVRNIPESKQQIITHRIEENADQNPATPLQSYLHNKPEVKSDCDQSLPTEAPTESKLDTPRSIPTDDTDGVCEQSPSVTIADFICEESLTTEAITRKDFDITRDLLSVNAEYVYEQYPTTGKYINCKTTVYSEPQSESNYNYINFKPAEASEPQSESNYEYFEHPNCSNCCDDRFPTHTTLAKEQNCVSDISKTRKSPTYISAKVSNGAQHELNNPSSSRLKYELATGPLNGILKSCHPLYQTISTVQVGTEEQSLVQKFSTKTYFTDKENIENFRNKNSQTRLSQDEDINERSTSNNAQRTIGNRTWSSNPSKLSQDKCTIHLCYPGEQIQQLNTAKRNLPSFQHCPCMLNTYVNLLKTYYRSNRRPIVSENFVNCC